MKNTLGDLNNHLFEQLERLNDDDLKGEELQQEMERAKSIVAVSRTIIENASLVLDAKKLVDNRLDADLKVPKILLAEE